MKIPRVLFAIAMLLVVPACAAQESETSRDDLIASYLEWRGGDAYAEAQSIVFGGSVEIYGFSGTAQIIDVRDESMRLDMELEVATITQVVTSDDAWQTNLNGQVEDLGGPQATDMRRELAMAFSQPLTDPEAIVTQEDDEEYAGRTWSVLKIIYSNGDADELFIDPDTGANEWTRVTRDTNNYMQHLTNWQVVSGVRLPGQVDILYEDEGRNQSFTWEQLYVNAPIPPTAFGRPSSADRVTFAEGTESTGWIPFDFFREQRIVMPVMLNGAETEAILDSGAEMTAVNLWLAEELGLELSGSVQAQGAGGTQMVQFATGVTLEVGGMMLNDMTVVVIDMSELEPRLGRRLPVILGKEVFNETIVDIDYPHAQIAFHDPGQWTYEGDGATVPLVEHEDSRNVEISVEGRDPVTVGFDIGQGAALTLFEGYVRSSGLIDHQPQSTQMSGGVGGAVVGPITTISSVTFGGVEFHDVPVSYAVGNTGSFDTTRESGNLGTDIYNRFHMIVDYGNDALYLEPDDARVAAPFAKNHAGLQVTAWPDGGEIVHVMAGSPAEAAGLSTEQRIARINGQAVDESYWLNGLWRWSEGPVGDVVTLEMTDGSTYELTLAEFY